MNIKQSALLHPSRAKIIFDENQAFQQVSLPKINRSITTNQLVPLKTGTKVDKSTDPQTPLELSGRHNQIQLTDSETKLIKWSVNYKEDIKKRFSMSTESYKLNEKFLEKWKSMQTLPKKKTRNHKTKKTKKIQKKLSPSLYQISNKLNDSSKYSFSKSLDTEEVIKFKDFEEKSPFFLNELNFADRLIQEKQQLKQKYGFEEKNLRKNNLILESVLLQRMQKRENNRNKNRGTFPIINK